MYEKQDSVLNTFNHNWWNTQSGFKKILYVLETFTWHFQMNYWKWRPIEENDRMEYRYKIIYIKNKHTDNRVYENCN